MPPTWHNQLVVTCAPGVRTQYANDNTISDWTLSRGYAFGSTDKPSSATSLFANGCRSAPAQPLLAWYERVCRLIIAAKEASPDARNTSSGISHPLLSPQPGCCRTPSPRPQMPANSIHLSHLPQRQRPRPLRQTEQRRRVSA